MSKPMHSPAPWRTHPTDDTVILAADGSSVAGVDGDYDYLGQAEVMEANARLIAAAPETAAERDRLREVNAALLEALKKALNFIKNTEQELGITLDSGDAARAAIAKATRETT